MALADIEAAAEELGRLLGVAEVLVPIPDTDRAVMVSGGGVVTMSSPAWNTGAAYAVLDAHAGVRDLENGLRRRVTGTQLRRGGSDANTLRALEAIARLIPALGASHVPPEKGKRCGCPECRVLRLLNRWANAVRLLAAVDTAVRWSAIRTVDGEPARCPYCQNASLRAAMDLGVVACGYPGCEDEDGRVPVARMEHSAVNGEALLAWSDGRVT